VREGLEQHVEGGVELCRFRKVAAEREPRAPVARVGAINCRQRSSNFCGVPAVAWARDRRANAR
jgi:hypothetical protein